jgi:16S rRNA (cytidine1402-2'-O)-methyltransferase
LHPLSLTSLRDNRDLRDLRDLRDIRDRDNWGYLSLSPMSLKSLLSLKEVRDEGCKWVLRRKTQNSVYKLFLMLYLVATPIGNLADITLRALEVLKSCDYILCEDTRHSRILLNYYQIHKPTKSYHKFNEASQAEPILKDLESGKQICLISDAGTPGISDPGAAIVKQCIERRLPITALPGPCAAIQALSCSGLPTERFQFLGFLPRRENVLKRELQKILSYAGTTICYESPHRLLKVLQLIHSIQPQRELVIARELTKKFEEIIRGISALLIENWKGTLKGEIVLLISPPSEEIGQDWSGWTPEEHVQWMQDTYALNRKEAIKMVADLRGVPKRLLYQQLHMHQ